MVKKKKIIIGMAIFIGLYLCFWTVAQIHNHFNPPVPGNSAEGMRNFYRMQAEQRKEQELLEDSKKMNNTPFRVK